MYGREGQDFTLSAVGDAIITRKVRTCNADRFRDVVSLVREADASFANLEVLLLDYDEGYPGANSGGTYMRAPPAMADELEWMGFNMLAAGNNHTIDYSHGGMEATMRELDSRNWVYAGLGENLATARAPDYLDTPGGRVGLVAASSFVTPGSEAGRQRPDIGGRPGLSPLRVNATYVVPDDVYEQIQQLSEGLGLEAIKERNERLGFPVPGADNDGFTLLNVRGDTNLEFERGDEFAVEQHAKDSDSEEILEQIREANRQSDWVVASLHAHEGEGGFYNDESVPEFVETFARECIDAGADAFIGHGPHVLRGVEIYEKAPIFYSLGDFLMQNELITRLPSEIYERYDLDPYETTPAELFDERVYDEDGERVGFLGDRTFWESGLPICKFEDGKLDRIEIYPLDLGFEEPRPRRGRPLLATGQRATQILDDLNDLSDPYGTDIVIEDGVGLIDSVE